jgi:spermidine synthase
VNKPDLTAAGTRIGADYSSPAFRTALYTIAFISGAIVMSFEMLGSRYLNPYFGNGIYTWAALISTVLAALAVGYFLGGFLGDRTVSASVLGVIIGVGSLYLLVLPSFAATILGFVLDSIDDVRLGSLCSALAIMFVPVMLLGIYTPFAIRLVLRAAQHSGTVSGAVYGISTAGSIVGTLGTTFFLIPTTGTHAITVLLGAAGIFCGLLLIAFDRARFIGKRGRSSAALFAVAVITAVAVIAFGTGRALAEEPFDDSVRAQMLKHGDGRVAHVETEYNDLFVDKRGSLLSLSSRFKGRPDYYESMIDLRDPDVMPVPYEQMMPVVLAYAQAPKRILMIGMGAGTISTYLARALPDAQIDVVELDPGVIAVGNQYFGLRESDKVHFIESDGRVYLNRHKDLYDVILLDAFRELGIPFHLLTREFYTLAKDHLAPGGVLASNLAANTKLYLSSLVTLRATFQTVDVYPVLLDSEGPQAIVVALPAPRPSGDSLREHALALQQERHFRYPLPELESRRVANDNSEGGDLLTDDFAPADLYRVTPIKGR